MLKICLVIVLLFAYTTNGKQVKTKNTEIVCEPATYMEYNTLHMYEKKTFLELILFYSICIHDDTTKIQNTYIFICIFKINIYA